MADRSRKHAMTLRLSDDEYRLLKAKAKIAHMRSMSDFIRQFIVESIIYDVDYTHLLEYNAQLAKIGNNINQIAHRINETRSIYQTDINEIKKEMDKVWLIQKSTLSKQPYREQ